jgi:DeoR family fructose operon transcriptional repressor
MIMFAHERFQAITSLLAKWQKMTVHELQRELGVSPATLRRDLTELEAAGKVIRVRGAVVHPGYFRSEPSFAQKSRVAAPAKRSIATEAAALVPSGNTVLVDAGSTCLEIGRLLLARKDVTLITHSLPLAALAHEGEAKVICIGGEVRSISGAATGALALSWLDHLRADWCFVGASGLSVDEGASTTELSEAAMKTAILHRSETKVLVADSGKWERPSTVQFAEWSTFDYWVTDGPLIEPAQRAIREQGPQIIICKPAKAMANRRK